MRVARVTPSREFRDELPPVLRAWHDWTAESLSGWSKAPQVAAWALRAVFLPVMACALVGLALAVIWPLACLGQMWRGLAGLVKPRVEVVPFSARRRG